MSGLLLFGTAFLVGLTFNAAPGPVFAATLRHGVRGGFRPALGVQIGSLAGDAVWAVIGLAAIGMLTRLDPLRLPITVGGAAYLGWLAWDSWQASRREVAVTDAADVHQAALRSGVLLSLTNPQNIGYWAAVGTSLEALGVRDPGVREYAVFFAGFMASSVVWSFLFAALVHWMLGGARLRWARVTYRLCAVMFLVLAIASLKQLWSGVQRSSQRPSVRLLGEQVNDV